MSNKWNENEPAPGYWKAVWLIALDAYKPRQLVRGFVKTNLKLYPASCYSIWEVIVLVSRFFLGVLGTLLSPIWYPPLLLIGPMAQAVFLRDQDRWEYVCKWKKNEAMKRRKEKSWK